MTERPILFSSPMVRAILDGTKTQTRRVVKFGELGDGESWSFDGMPSDYVAKSWADYLDCPYGVPGDRLWVRETWAMHPDEGGPEAGVLYRATDTGWDDENSGLRWKPSIHMPRWASRITLEVTEVRVQRLNEISEEDAKAEGSYLGRCSCVLPRPKSPVEALMDRNFKQTWCHIHGQEFKHLWQSINAKRPGASWDENPWVWAVGFRRVRP